MSDVEKKLDAIEAELRNIQDSREHAEPPVWAPLYYEALEKTGVVEQAVKIVGRPSSKTTYYKYKESCPAFSEKWDESLELHRLSVAKAPRATV